MYKDYRIRNDDYEPSSFIPQHLGDTAVLLFANAFGEYDVGIILYFEPYSLK